MIPPGETGQIFIPEGELLFGPVDGVVVGGGKRDVHKIINFYLFMINYPANTGESQLLLLFTVRAKSMNPRSTSVPMS